MKKYFSLASALMLALGMGMTSCSNDLDEVQAPAEPQPELHKLYLSATAPNSTGSRAYVEGTADSDAITITGWKAGDKLYGIYQIVTDDQGDEKYGVPGMVEFTFNGSTHEFESEETSVTNEEIKYFLHGNNPTVESHASMGEFYGYSSLDATFLFCGFEMVDLDTHSTDIPMWGEASVVGGKLAANMQMVPNLALVCVHNDSGSEIEVSMDMVNGGNTYPVKGLELQYLTGNPVNFMLSYSGDAALTATIPAGGKAYLPMKRGSYDYSVKVNGTVIGTKAKETITAGKVYKLIYTGAAPAAFGTGTAKRTGDIDVTWVQLWKDGPKFAEYNVGAANNKAEDCGGYYCWGGSKDKDSNKAYKSGTNVLSGNDDTATKLWGSAWRMPTQAEVEALLANCSVVWTTVNGVNGRKYTGKGDYKDNSVFLPAGGAYDRSRVSGLGSYGGYWSSTPDDDDAFYLYISSGDQTKDSESRAKGFSVRAVLAE